MWRIFCSLLLTVCFQMCFWCFWRFCFHLDTSGFPSCLIIDQNDCQIYSGQCRLPWGESLACGHGDCLDHVIWLGSSNWKWIISVLGFRTSLHEKEENELSTNFNSLLLTMVWPAASGSYCLDLSLLTTELVTQVTFSLSVVTQVTLSLLVVFAGCSAQKQVWGQDQETDFLE